ncbi:MAG TPA: ATPase domain-containing protein [Bryobacteraceae bacterium]|jgi:hypothetical protein|nr:ATPase domain-containing protein [Bryobacteraceae bacterium]
MVNFLAVCNGSRETAVESILAFCRAIWQTHPAQPGARRDEQSLRQALAGEAAGAGANDAPALRLLIEYQNDPPAYCGLVMAQRVLAPHVPCQDVQYFAMRHIRQRGKLGYSPAAVHMIHSMAGAINRACEPHGRCELAELRRVLAEFCEAEKAGAGFAPVFLELCAALGLMKPLTGSSEVQFGAPVPADMLLSHLFGMPSGIAGLDLLFGGGGMMLIDAPCPQEAGAEEYRGTVGGRTVLAVGPFGSGKSLLSLQFAVEIARKGGIAWVMALEQAPEECLLSLEAIGTATLSPFFEVIMGPDPWRAFRERTAAGGAIVFLPPSVSPYEQFLGGIQNKLNFLDKYPLRLLIIDPVNSLMRSREKDAELRAKVTAFLQEAKHAGVNIWLNCERPETEEQDSFEENISDTVLRLGVEWHGVYQKRNLQVIKSRLQRELKRSDAVQIKRFVVASGSRG